MDELISAFVSAMLCSKEVSNETSPNVNLISDHTPVPIKTTAAARNPTSPNPIFICFLFLSNRDNIIQIPRKTQITVTTFDMICRPLQIEEIKLCSQFILFQ